MRCLKRPNGKNIKDQNQWIPPWKLNVSLKSCLKVFVIRKKDIHKLTFSTFNLLIQKLKILKNCEIWGIFWVTTRYLKLPYGSGQIYWMHRIKTVSLTLQKAWVYAYFSLYTRGLLEFDLSIITNENIKIYK